jgi:hypothetical protein
LSSEAGGLGALNPGIQFDGIGLLSPRGHWPELFTRCVLQTGDSEGKDCWMGQVIHCGGAARDPSIQNLFQSADVDSGVIRYVEALSAQVVTPL